LILIHLRPVDWSRSDEWKRVAQVLDPAWERTLEQFLLPTQVQFSDLQLSDVEQAWISIRPSDADDLEVSVMLQLLPDGKLPRRLQDQISLAMTGRGSESSRGSSRRSVIVLGHDPARLVIGKQELLEEIRHRRSRATVLRREIERLRADSVAANHLTVFFVPNFLAQHGRELLPSGWWPVLEFVDQTLGEGVFAASWSVTIDEFEAFAELRVIPTWEARHELGRSLPPKLQRLCGAASISLGESSSADSSWRPLRDRFGAMCEFALRYVRYGEEQGQIIVNVSLPAAAAHNLLLGTGLALRSRTAREP
jgi:hypothetical protein